MEMQLKGVGAGSYVGVGSQVWLLAAVPYWDTHQLGHQPRLGLSTRTPEKAR
jgi:hypothetical protein